MLQLSQQTRDRPVIGSDKDTRSQSSLSVARGLFWRRFLNALMQALSAWVV
jgi:hypothetical protein